MNLQQPNGNDATQTSNRSKSVVPCSGLCTRCIDTCRGNCEVFKSSFRGREVIYPGPFGEMTAGGDKDYPIDYSHLNILGYALGAKGLPEGVEGTPDNTLFPMVDTETEFGTANKIKMRVPIFTGALGSTEIARKHWDSFAVGAAISGVSIVCGENVCGIDPGLELDSNGKVSHAPDMKRRVESYRRYREEGYGDILVQMNVEDTRLGVAEYCIEKLGVETMELKWGQGAKCIGGEIKVDSLERALELQRRGYLVTPDPSNPAIQAAYEDGAIKQFERHSRLGFVDEEGFYAEVQRLRDLGAKRVTLKTGAYAMRELAMAIKWSSNAKIDLLTIDGAPGGTGMSPWRMMEEWGVPTFYLQSMANELIGRLRAKGAFIPDIAIAGGFSSEDHIFKVLAMGAPHTKAVCMGRALMIPGFVGGSIERWMKTSDLPKTVAEFGTTKEEIFVTYETLKAKYGAEVDAMPLGAIAVYTYS
ncbi:MAG: glutamate synthase-related protein, partial [Actinomycetota bacterium]|nr:glutamate synthase-related protein [Actinomycetota bacterium]